MKYDVVISNPPFRIKERGWETHSNKHLHLLDSGSYYVLVCPADTKDEAIRDRCSRFTTLKIKQLDLTYKEPIFYYIWKK